MHRLYEDFAYGDEARADCAWSLDTDWPILPGDLTTEVAVIGGGYTGLSTALHLAQAGVEVTVLEAKSPGWGASGRNGGFCCVGGAKMSETTMARRFGLSGADEFFNTQRAAIDLVAEILDTHGIDASRHSDGEAVIAHNDKSFAGFADEAAHMAHHGIATEIIPEAALRERGLAMAGAKGAIHVKLGFGLDPGAYVAGLARAAEATGAKIYANSPVTRIIPDASGYRLTTPAGTVRARKIVVATNGYSSEDVPEWLRSRFLPVQSNVIVTRTLTEAEKEAQGWTSDLMAYDSRTLLHYFRLMPDGRFLFGMRGGTRARPRDVAVLKAQIRADFEAQFPEWAGVETPSFWSGLANLARNLVPYAGPIKGWDNAWTGMAYHGNGVAMGTQTGKILAGLVQGKGEVPVVMRGTPPRFPLGMARRVLLDASYAMYNLKDAR